MALELLDLEHLLDNNTVLEIFQHGHERLGFQPVLMEHRESQHDLCKLVGRLRCIQGTELPFPPSTGKGAKCLLGLKVEHQKR